MQPPDFLKLPENWRRQWWFFNPEQTNSTTDAAFKWELVRRSEAYRQIWQKYRQACDAKRRGELSPREAFGWLLATQESLLIRLVFYNEVSPDVCWIDLSPKQRTDIESYSSLLPELNAPQAVGDAMSIALAEITEEDGNRRVKLLWPPVAGLRNLGIPESEALNNVPNGKWIIVFFDAYVPYDRLARQFDEVVVGPSVLDLAAKCQFGRIPKFAPQIEQKLREMGKSPLDRPQAEWDEVMRLYKPVHPAEWLDCQGGRERIPRLPALRKQTHMVPTLYDPRAACLIPPICDAAGVRKLFRYSVHPAHRASWLPTCEQFWETQRAKHRLDPLPQLKFVKSGQSKYRWIALAAHDLESLYKEDPSTKFLCYHWLALARGDRVKGKSLAHKLRIASNELHNLRSEISDFMDRLWSFTSFPGKRPAR